MLPEKSLIAWVCRVSCCENIHVTEQWFMSALVILIFDWHIRMRFAGLNAFSDLSHDEFNERYTGGLNLRQTRVLEHSPKDLNAFSCGNSSCSGDVIPGRRRSQSSVNWVLAGAVSPIRNQASNPI